MAKTRVYKRRHPERTDYYRITESRFEELERMWPECFEQKYGYLRKEVVRAIYAFLDCGIPENGVARVFCDGCGRDYFVPFSCRVLGACPSCSTKRSILFGEKIRGLVRPISHLHVTFTVPKVLRAWFRRNRKLLKRMVQSANWAIRSYFIETLGIADGSTGGIYCVHSHGNWFNHHPHVHALVPAGIMKDGVFHELRGVSSPLSRTSIKSGKSSSILVSRPYGPSRSRRKRHRPGSLGRRLSTTSLTWTSTYRTRSIRIEPSCQHSSAPTGSGSRQNPSTRPGIDQSVA